jgi:hypothetical protein
MTATTTTSIDMMEAGEESSNAASFPTASFANEDDFEQKDDDSSDYEQEDSQQPRGRRPNNNRQGQQTFAAREAKAVAVTKFLFVLFLVLGATVAAIVANSYTRISEEQDFQSRVRTYYSYNIVSYYFLISSRLSVLNESFSRHSSTFSLMI